MRITGVNDTMVTFEGSDDNVISTSNISGQIDRVTGAVYATHMQTNDKTHDRMMTVIYQLQCKPTERMF